MRELGLICLYGLTAFDDIRTKQVRCVEIIVFGIIGLLINFISPSLSIKSLLGGIVVGLVLFLISHLTREKIGKGDAAIIAVTGLYLGYVNTLVLLWISSIISLVVGLVIIKKNKLGSGYEMPFVPFLLLGYLSMYVIRFIWRICL